MSRHGASRRRRASIICHPVSDLARPRVLPYVFGCHHALAAFFQGGDSRAINTRPEARLSYSVDPGKQISFLLWQQSPTFFLIEKEDGVCRKSFRAGGS